MTLKELVLFRADLHMVVAIEDHQHLVQGSGLSTWVRVQGSPVFGYFLRHARAPFSLGSSHKWSLTGTWDIVQCPWIVKTWCRVFQHPRV